MKPFTLPFLSILGVVAFWGCGGDSSGGTTSPQTKAPQSVQSGKVEVTLPDSALLVRKLASVMSLTYSVKDSLYLSDWTFSGATCSLRVLYRGAPTGPYTYDANSSRLALLGKKVPTDSAAWRSTGWLLRGVGSPGFDGRAALIVHANQAVGILVQCPMTSQMDLEGLLAKVILHD